MKSAIKRNTTDVIGTEQFRMQPQSFLQHMQFLGVNSPIYHLCKQIKIRACTKPNMAVEKLDPF